LLSDDVRFGVFFHTYFIKKVHKTYPASGFILLLLTFYFIISGSCQIFNTQLSEKNSFNCGTNAFCSCTIRETSQLHEWSFFIII